MNKGFCEIQIDKLVRAPWNYKEDNIELVKKLQNNIERNGQIENIIVREIGDEVFEVVNGNHRLDVLKNIGIKKVHCYNLGEITETQAKRIAIETNETRFNTSIISLSEILKEIVEDFGFDDIEITMPFSEEEIRGLISNDNLNLDDFFSKSNDDSKDNTQIKELICPHCGKNVYEEINNEDNSNN